MLRRLLKFHNDHCPILALGRRVCRRRHGS